MASSQASSITPAVGDLLVAALYWDESPDTITLSDSLHLAWTTLPAQGLVLACGGPSGNATGAQLAYAIVDAAGADVVTVAQTAGTHPLGMFLLEYAGVDTAQPLDVTAGLVAPSASSVMTGPVVTTTATDAIVALFVDTISFGSDSPGSGYTEEALDSGFPNILEDKLAPPGTYTPTASMPSTISNDCWVATVAAFRGG